MAVFFRVRRMGTGVVVRPGIELKAVGNVSGTLTGDGIQVGQ